eukprot:154211-Pleurochrysis_carterae.AAC.1
MGMRACDGCVNICVCVRVLKRETKATNPTDAEKASHGASPRGFPHDRIHQAVHRGTARPATFVDMVPPAPDAHHGQHVRHAPRNEQVLFMGPGRVREKRDAGGVQGQRGHRARDPERGGRHQA